MPRVSKKTAPPVRPAAVEEEECARTDVDESAPQDVEAMQNGEAEMGETSSSPAEAAAAVRPAAKKRKTDRPKQPPNAFMIFSKEQRVDIDKSMKVTDQAKEIGARWQALEEEQKTRYKQMAADLKAAVV